MIKYFDCEQGTPEWFKSRAGCVTASNLSKVLAKGQGITRAKYMRQLASEIITGEPANDGFEGNIHTERGKELEPKARELLSIRIGKDIKQVGFYKNPDLRIGCSPDGVIGNDIMNMDMGVEIKCCLPDIQIDRLMRGGVPSEYVSQVEASLLVTGAPSWTFCSFSSGLPLHKCEVTLSDSRKAEIIEELMKFNTELDELVEKVRSMF